MPSPEGQLEHTAGQLSQANRRKKTKDSPEQNWLVVGGCEPGPSTAVAVRDAYFKGIRRDCFVLQGGGSYKNNTGHCKDAFNRVMFCTIECREPYFDTGEDDDDEIGIAVAHMHYGCARTSNKGGATTYTNFWDRLAEVIVHYKSRVLCMDANMALFCVAPELRARGVMASMAAFSFPARR